MIRAIFTIMLVWSSAFCFSEISNEELVELSRQNAIVVDVRLPEEWQQSGVIAGSFLITYFDKNFQPQKVTFMSEINKLSGGNRNKDIVVVCRSGARSRLVSGILEREGYKKVFNLQSGILGWYAQRLPFTPYIGATKNIRP